MKPFLTALVVVLAFCVLPISASVSCFDLTYGRWTCTYSCCFSYFGCCRSLGSVYWYAWVIVVIIILVCVCTCACGSYGYRRYYYVRHAPPTTTVVTVAGASRQDPTYYQQFNTGDKYQPYTVPVNAPPPYSATEEQKQLPL